MRGWGFLFVATMFAFHGGAVAQQTFAPLVTGAQYRDVVFHPQSGSLFVSVYDGNQVLRIDLESGEIADRAIVGSGAAALALSLNGATLAAVNRLDDSVTVLAVPDMEILGTIQVGSGPVDVTASRRGFAVVNSFSDSVTVVDAQGEGVLETIEGVESVPTVVASSSETMVVGVRAPKSLLVYEGFSGTLLRRITLPSVPSAAAHWRDALFVVGMESHLAIVDAAAGRIVNQIGQGARDVVVSENRILALSGNALVEFDGELNRIDTTPLDVSPWAFDAVGSAVAVAAPFDESVSIKGSLPPGMALPPPVEEPMEPVEAREQVQEPPPGAPVVEEAQPARPQEPEERPVPEPQDEPMVEEAEPVEPDQAEPSARVPEEPVVEEAEPSVEVEEPAPSETLEASMPKRATREQEDRAETEPTEQRAVRPTGSARRPDPLDLGLSEPRPPRLRSPGESPPGPGQPTTFTEAISQGALLGGSETGFTLPQWPQPLENLEFGRMSSRGDVEEFEDGVRFQIENTLVTADRLKQDKKTGQVIAEGNVKMTQERASLTADRIEYIPAPEEPPVLVGPFENGAEEEVKPRGTFIADNIHLVEPTRELEAKFVEYDLSEETGDILHAHGRAGLIYFNAETLRVLGPETIQGQDVWVTTCDLPTPHYRLRLRDATIRENQVVLGTNARLQLKRANTPFFLPKWKSGGYLSSRRTSLDFDTGRDSDIGFFLNVGQWFAITPNLDLAARLMPTTKQGIGIGMDAEYDFMANPASALFRSNGSLQTMYTTQDNGYTQFYHRHELTPNTTVVGQVEQWYDEDFVKDFFYNEYRNRTGPRTFVNVTHTMPGQILTGTAAVSTHGFTRETEKLPEVTYHLLERELAENLYFTFDTYNGYYERNRFTDNAARTVNTARLTYDWNARKWLNITPWAELEASWYSKTLDDKSSEERFSGTAGITAQSRLQRAYDGRWGFSGFKHVILPSVTYLFRPETGLDIEDTPRLDALDNAPGRSRVESKLENVIYGQDAETNEVWQVGRVTFYHGNDLQNERRKAQDYEIEIDVRPRPWWGLVAVGEHHSIDNEGDFVGSVPILRRIRELRDEFREATRGEEILDPRRGDFNRALGFLYYDTEPFGGRYNGRIGFAFTETDEEVFNKEVLYGLGYALSEKWGFAFEHRYDIERGEFVRQTYEIRRQLHKWEASLLLRDRESGFDVGLEFSLSAFPGARVRF